MSINSTKSGTTKTIVAVLLYCSLAQACYVHRRHPSAAPTYTLPSHPLKHVQGKLLVGEAEVKRARVHVVTPSQVKMYLLQDFLLCVYVCEWERGKRNL